MKTYHILNGSALEAQLVGLKGEIIVFKECLIDGDIKGESFEELFSTRAQFFEMHYGISTEDYDRKSKAELSKISKIENKAQVNLWFESDLFCLMNFCCAVHFLFQANKDYQLFLVSPSNESWDGFGGMSVEELFLSLKHKKEINKTQQEQLSELWKAFQTSNWTKLRSLAHQLNSFIHKIEEVIEAHIARFPSSQKHGRPEQSILKIIEELEDPSFANVFKAFNKKEGIYGFGDIQVKRIMSTLQ